MDDRPIALFDSGFGGLTVARAVIDLMRNENLVYVGDTARYPYGAQTLEDVACFSREIGDELVHRFNAKALVVACNTAAAATLEELQRRYDVPVLGVIEPGVRALKMATETGRVGVIGTVATINSGAYQHAIGVAAPDLELCALGCPGFVEFVERGEFRTERVHVLAERLLSPAVDAKIDALLLGCTHYPYLGRTISEVMGRDVVLVSSADETAFELRALIGELGIGRLATADSPPPTRTFLTTGDVEWFQRLGSQLLGPELQAAGRLELG